ncbi:hypothetical protein IO45_12340 [Gallibacterium anatis]|uniref:hypothetical protein n=1 Tax=Gallibacterium anatis TaxID=750 RepID=UPI000531AB64|nr:hypothetical protein [Gallibacterium anatis]KGQ55827.1 hypothetical protein IO45_12340 [Gallibacterium anatis]
MKRENNTEKTVIELKKPHLISFSIYGQNWKRVQISCHLVSVLSISNNKSTTKLLNILLNNKTYTIDSDSVLTKIKLQSGKKFYFDEFFSTNLIEQINAGMHDKPIKSPANPNDENLPIIWADKPIKFSYPYNGGLRELRLDRIMLNPEKGIYWKCFCFMKKSTRTFKESSLGDVLFVDNKEFSIDDFYRLFLKIDPNTMELIN